MHARSRGCGLVNRFTFPIIVDSMINVWYTWKTRCISCGIAIGMHVEWHGGDGGDGVE